MGMIEELKELYRFRELLVSLVQRDLKIRYKNSALGFFWSLLNPLLTVLVMSFVLEHFVYDKVPSLSAYILAAYLPFAFFQLAVMDSAQTVLGAMSLVKKIYFPREILPIASVIANFIHLILALGVFFVYLVLIWLMHNRVGEFPIRPTVVYVPILLVITFALALGLSFIVSALNTFYEDVKYLVGVMLYLMFFLCPVMYFSEMVANSTLNQQTNGMLYKLYHLNPIASIATAFRKTMVAPPAFVPTRNGPIPPTALDWRYMVVTAVISFAILIGGYAVFNRMKWRFVERP